MGVFSHLYRYCYIAFSLQIQSMQGLDTSLNLSSHYLQTGFSTRMRMHELHSNMMLVAIGMATCMHGMHMMLMFMPHAHAHSYAHSYAHAHAQAHAHAHTRAHADAAGGVPALSHRAPPSDLPHFLPSEEVSSGKVRPKHWGGSRPYSLPNRRIRSVPAVMLPH